MKIVVIAIVVIALAACSSDPEPQVTEDDAAVTAEAIAEDDHVGDPAGDSTTATGAADDEAQTRTFAAREGIPVTLTLLGADAGGRQTGYFDGYRPTVDFDSVDGDLACSLGGPPGGGAFEPGETHDVVITCADEVTIEPGASGFAVVEGGRQIGSGDVHLSAD